MQEDFTTINYAEVKIILQEVHCAANFKQLLLITFGFIGDDYLPFLLFSFKFYFSY